MKKIARKIYLLLIIFVAASCVDRPTSYDSDFHEQEFVIDRKDGGQKVFRASDQGEILIKTDWDSPDYDEVHFDFEISYEDGTPVSGAKVHYQETEDFILIRIEGTEDDGATIIAGTPEEILSLFENEEGLSMRKSATFAPGDSENIIISGALIIGGKIVIAKAAKIYIAYNTTRAIWDTYLQVREVSKFFTDSIKLESGGRLFCRSANDIAGLASDLANIAKSTGNIIKTFKSPPGAEEIIGDKVYEATFRKSVDSIEEYVADFVNDTVHRLFEDYMELADVPIGLIVYMPNEVRLPEADGEEPGFMEIYPNHELCQTPQVTTNSVTNITPSTATSGGTITHTGGMSITQKGICWSTSQNPDINDTCTDEGPSSGSFTSYLSDLSSDTRYYVRAYAENSTGIGYGQEETFITQESDDRTFDMNICDVWQVAQSGGVGVTVDNWDISEIPPGATFDIRFEAFSIPDKFVIEYPSGTVQHDTGWRGSSSYNNNPRYPGGIAGPGSGQENDLFTKGSYDMFRVVVTGVDNGTAWNYQVRCRYN